MSRMWTVEDLRDHVAMVTADPAGMLRTLDRRGLGPIQFAALQSAIATDSLLPLLALLEPPQEKETSQLDQIIALLKQVAESQIRTERRLVELESRLAGKASPSPQPSRSEAPASRS